MMLYHGGAAASLPRMKREGILPRAHTRVKSNWTHTINSNSKAVYVTDAYAWHFAINSVTNVQAEPGIILEIDRDRLVEPLLCPDEDWMEQVTRKHGPDDEHPNHAPIEWSMKRRTMYYRKIARANPQVADASLEGMGTAGYYGPIHWRAVTRYVVIDWKQLDPHLFVQAVDSQVSALNYMILKDRHRAFTKWFFGDPVTPEEVSGNAGWQKLEPVGDKGVDQVIDAFNRQNEIWEKAMANREGLRVVDLEAERIEADRLYKIPYAHRAER